MSAKLAGRLPDYPDNGLERIAHKLVNAPEDVIVAVVRLDTNGSGVLLGGSTNGESQTDA